MSAQPGLTRPLPPGLELAAGETVLLDEMPSVGGTFLAYIFTLGLYHFWRMRTYFMLTSHRVIHAKGRVTKTLRAVPLEKVQDATLTTTLWLGYVSLTTAGGAESLEKLGPMRPNDARAFLAALQQRLHAGASQKPADQVIDVTDQIRKLAELRDTGLLTPEEFDAKKRQLLGL